MHRALGSTPQTAWDRSYGDHGAPRRLPVADIQRIFLWHEQRKVDKTGVIQLAGNRYEVDVALMGKMVDCRYDSFALDQIHISFVFMARRIPMPRRSSCGIIGIASPTTDLPPATLTTGLNFAQLAAGRQQDEHGAKQARIRYAQPTTPRARQPWLRDRRERERWWYDDTNR